jgi:predicted MFS family arabinose efflux permease
MCRGRSVLSWTRQRTTAVGPPIGSLLVGGLGWHLAFLINLPFAVLALAMAARWIPRDPPAGAPGHRGDPPAAAGAPGRFWPSRASSASAFGPTAPGILAALTAPHDPDTLLGRV